MWYLSGGFPIFPQFQLIPQEVFFIAVLIPHLWLTMAGQPTGRTIKRDQKERRGGRGARASYMVQLRNVVKFRDYAFKNTLVGRKRKGAARLVKQSLWNGKAFGERGPPWANCFVKAVPMGTFAIAFGGFFFALLL